MSSLQADGDSSAAVLAESRVANDVEANAAAPDAAAPQSGFSAPGSTAIPQEVFDVLRGEENPFDANVQTRRAGAQFARSHAPTVNRAIFETVRSAIARYRTGVAELSETSTEDDVPRSGVAVIEGKRGSGKTHLLHALRSCEPGCLIVAPNRFDAHRTFPEYLLQALVHALHDESERTSQGTLVRLADWFARRALVQALYAMSSSDWLLHNTSRRSAQFLSMFGWRVRSTLDRKEFLIGDLTAECPRGLRELCRFREQEPQTLRRIARKAIEASESEKTVGGQIRRSLALKLMDLAWDGDVAPTIDFLLDGFTQVSAVGTPARDTLVEELFQALVELFLLFGRPVVFVFDALESLLGDPPNPERCQQFFGGLANVLDVFRGLPFFALAESGHWQLMRRSISSYAQQRFEQGVPTRGDGPVSHISMPPVSLDDLRGLVRKRMEPMLKRAVRNGVPVVAEICPFQDDDLNAALSYAGATPGARPLRQVLQRLGQRYAEIVFGRASPDPIPDSKVVAVTVAAWEEVKPILENLWTPRFRNAGDKVSEKSPVALADSLYAGMKLWFGALSESTEPVGTWRVAAVETQAFGNHPTHGQRVVTTWSRDGASHRRGVALFLATGAGMPNALDALLSSACLRKKDLDDLLILWPKTAAGAGEAHELLPGRTRAIWDGRSPSVAARTKLQIVDPTELAPWLAIEPWAAEVGERHPQISAEHRRRFLVEKTNHLIPVVAPPEG